jgi:hypothetical protein
MAGIDSIKSFYNSEENQSVELVFQCVKCDELAA